MAATLRSAMARDLLCCDIDGFSLHAAVRVQARELKRREQLSRTITRQALSDERVWLKAAGQMEPKLKTPWRDGTTHLVMSPLDIGAAAGLLLIVVLIGVCVPLFNVAAVWPMARQGQRGFAGALLRNPLIIGTASCLSVHLLGLSISGWLEPTFSRMGLRRWHWA